MNPRCLFGGASALAGTHYPGFREYREECRREFDDYRSRPLAGLRALQVAKEVNEAVDAA